jgi:RNA polymerase sigma factor (sigma-70 family)
MSAAVAPRPNGLFASTRWTLVLEAGANSDVTGQQAMEELCRLYWPAIYAYVRRRGYGVEDAQDITQSFFQHILEHHSLRRASRERGRFRSFLLGSLKFCLADEQARRHTLKRGGAVQFVSVEALKAEELNQQYAASDLTPDQLLDARWARVVVDHALASLRGQFEKQGKAKLFEALCPFLGGDKVSYAAAAERAGVTLAAVKTLIHRLRSQFAAAVRGEIMQTVSAPHEVDTELRQLRSLFACIAGQQTSGMDG